MNKERFDYIVDRIREAEASGETDTRLGKVLAKWDFDIPVEKDGRWLLEGFIMTFKRDREILSAIDPSISPDLPPHLMDPKIIAYFFSIPLEELDWPGDRADALVLEKLTRIEAKLDTSRQATPDAGFVSIKQAAALTGLSTKTIRRAIRRKRHRLIAFNAGSIRHPLWRIKKEDLIGWLEAETSGQDVPAVPMFKSSENVSRHFPNLK